MHHLGGTTRAIAMIAIAGALSLGAIGTAAAGPERQGAAGPMAAFSDPNYTPAGTSTQAGMGAFSDLNYRPEAGQAQIGMGAFSDPNAFGPIPKAAPVEEVATTTSSSTWSDDWRTIGLGVVAVLLAISLALVSTLYVRNRRQLA